MYKLHAMASDAWTLVLMLGILFAGLAIISWQNVCHTHTQREKWQVVGTKLALILKFFANVSFFERGQSKKTGSYF